MTTPPAPVPGRTAPCPQRVWALLLPCLLILTLACKSGGSSGPEPPKPAAGRASETAPAPEATVHSAPPSLEPEPPPPAGPGESPVPAATVAAKIAAGHAFDKHVVEKEEFADLGITTRGEFAEHIQRVITHATASRHLRAERQTFWLEATGTVVIWNPQAADGGTALRPRNAEAYYHGLR